ncbi:hypothetical protein AN963_07845 [Brevibacillus choshinensis]|uniref:Nucleoside 2-deoxyribosyltransferase n=1 Tax=Brevibacillus choshinensis TaxID=54911 RepID=A0ABR5NDK7_BRECH|nr:nucleoside 2-deoxyribosyltransferase [Brevibacillus choshinensis]KQL49629.1 hypothetical protein AN963_07845 [Brevibacillus choshinensis]MED4582700.1 nucleoside 2-deoxyribosyltransferase [Brevibacillus choshinensis]
MKSIYLAGPDVFYKNSIEVSEEKKRICEKYGFLGIFPADNSLPFNKEWSKSEQATAIYKKNIELIEKADIVVANLNVFRGAEPDSGTAFEVGYAEALGKKLYAYIDDSLTIPEKVQLHFGEIEQLEDGKIVDKNGMKVENFGNSVNLMLSVPCQMVYGSFEECMRRVNEDFTAG